MVSVNPVSQTHRKSIEYEIACLTKVNVYIF